MNNILKSGVILSILWCCFGARLAYSYPITIGITANVTYVSDSGNYLEGKIKVGDIITGSYTYESTTTDSNPSTQVGDYCNYSAPSGIELSCGGFVFKSVISNMDFLIEIINAPFDDGYNVISLKNSPLSNGVAVDVISWQLNDPTGLVFSSDVLPLTAPILQDWQYEYNLIIEGDRKYFIEGVVTSVQLIPEPSTFLLFLLGAGFFKKHKHL